MPDNLSLTIKLDPHTAQQLAERAREEGVTPEQYAAELVAELMADDASSWPPLSISDEELRASIEQQRREIAAGTAQLYSREEVMAGARAIFSESAGSRS
ncbi:MAG TPA: hypothetical protein VEA80_09340 [Vitreimonas sp.]|uniref:hypothetical protein n=1 Tax=Vitreimonas sp. TaxID=3069702 RepID=UPI002D4B9A87|nr:hypothetical protein [Vitreimonas sp.]HYD87666.1 hypothetical protein [Vitreimonas sp.]